MAVIFALSVIAPIMLFDLNGPILADSLEQYLGRGFLGPETGNSVNGFVGRFDDTPFAEELHGAIDAENLRGSRQADRRSIDWNGPELALFDAAMSFIERLSLRGEYCPARAAGLWPERAVGCP